jgi:hypothetical protein
VLFFSFAAENISPTEITLQLPLCLEGLNRPAVFTDVYEMASLTLQPLYPLGNIPWFL